MPSAENDPCAFCQGCHPADLDHCICGGWPSAENDTPAERGWREQEAGNTKRDRGGYYAHGFRDGYSQALADLGFCPKDGESLPCLTCGAGL